MSRARSGLLLHGYILLGHILETVTGTPLKELIQQRVIEPLDLKDTCYNPPEAVLPRVVYTEWCVRRKEFLRGTVHDENAQALGGVSANAGLFSTARDLAKFAQMILNRGEINGKRLLNDSTFELLSKCFTEGLNERRTLGWLLHRQDPRGRASFSLSHRHNRVYRNICSGFDRDRNFL